MPMSEIAEHGAARRRALPRKRERRRGVLLAGAPGVAPATVVILGCGAVGTSAAQITSGMGADVTVLDRNPEALTSDHVPSGRSCAHTVFDSRRGGASLSAS